MSIPTKVPRGIKGITDNPRPPVVAKAKIGRMSEKGYPEKLDHIIFVEPQTGTPIDAFAALGPQPTSFLAVFPPNVEVDAGWKRYGKTGLKCRGDGDLGVDRETGEERQCAGEYNKDHPEDHLCPFARPTQKNGKTYPPECKPMLSLRLVVPLAGALGLVQLDTGGAASSVPTLWWQIEQLRFYSGGELGGVAVKVSIRPFTTKHGISFAWNLATPSDSELEQLERQFGQIVPARILGPGSALKEIPAMTETPDQDLYGLPDEAVEEAPIDLEPLPEEPVSNAYQGPTETNAPQGPVGVPGEVVAAEMELLVAMKGANLPEAKIRSTETTMVMKRGEAEEADSWNGYVDWLLTATERARKAGEG